MESFLPAFIISFREGLEAFLIIAIMLKFLDKTNNSLLKKDVWKGTCSGVAVSIALGGLLMMLSSSLGGIDAVAKLWESGASLAAVTLISTFIVWMIRHGSEMKQHIESKTLLNLSTKGVFLLAFVMVLREGAEIAIFSFAGKYSPTPIFIGIVAAIAIVSLIHHSIVKIKLSTLFAVTLGYLILQAGFLLGYSIHEGLSALKTLGYLSEDNILYTKAFDLSQTIFYHKEGIIGLPLYVSVGWYSKPEWIQLIVHYSYCALFFVYWKNFTSRKKLT